MQDLIVVGAGTSVVVKLIHAINRADERWNLVGFVDDDESKWGTDFCDYPVLGGLIELEAHVDAQVVCFIFGGNIRTRLGVLGRLDETALHYATLVHPTVDLESVDVGEGCIIQGGSWIQSGVGIGRHVGIGPACIVGHDVQIANTAWLGPRVTILGRVEVMEGATLGAGCVIKGDVTIGANSLVGMGAVVMRDVVDNATVVGNPARVLSKDLAEHRHPF